MSELKTNLEQILQEKNEKIISQNIKKDIEVLGVTGSYDKEDIKELQDELADAEQELADVRRDLDNSTATISGSGENVTLNGTAEARFKKLGVSGNSEQETTEGKNLANSNEMIQGYWAYANGDFVRANTWICTPKIECSGNTAYTYQFSNASRWNGFVFYDENGRYISTSNVQNGSSTEYRTYTATSPSNARYLVVNIAGFPQSTDAISVLDLINFQLEKNSIATSYEPYTGGTASPNPDYPQEITNVTGDVEVVVENKNLLDTIEKQSYTQNGITVTNNGDGSFTLNGTNTNSSYIDLYITPNTNSQTIIKDLENGTYLLKIYELSGNINFNSASCYVVATGKGENNQYLSSMMEFALHNNKQYQVKSLENCKLTTVKFYIGSGVTFNNYRFKIMMTKSSDTSLPYVEHKHQTFTFPLGNEKLMLGDYLADDGIHHVRKQTEITENNINLVYNATSQFGVNCANIRKDALGYKTAWGSRYCLINKYSEISTVQEVRSGTFGTVFDQIYLRIFDDRFTDTETAKQLLIGTIIEILLAEEVIVPYTSAQQEVYNQIKQALSYDEQTNVSSNTIALFDIIALRNMNDTLNTLENDVDLLE